MPRAVRKGKSGLPHRTLWGSLTGCPQVNEEGGEGGQLKKLCGDIVEALACAGLLLDKVLPESPTSRA